MRNLIIVGLGDYYKKILEPTLQKLHQENRAVLIATVDIYPRTDSSDVFHVVRNGEPLSQLLQEFKHKDPIVILAHANHMHVSDTIDLCSHGFKVALEKPYALNVESLRTLFNAVNSELYFLIEYYVMMKAIPLLLGYGLVDTKSFYCTDSVVKPLEFLVSKHMTIDDFAGSLPDIVGDIESVHVDLLEGEGDTGTLQHRGVSLVDIRAGGGMIQDLGIHALAPIYAISGYLGSLKYTPDHKSLNIAKCVDCVTMAKEKFNLPDSSVGETYASFTLSSKTGVPVTVRLGKYVFGDRNQRGISIQGKKSKLYLDLNNPKLFINDIPALEVTKDQFKYYPVIRAMIDYFETKPLFTFPVNKASAKAQEAVLNVQSEAYRIGVPVYYPYGIDPVDIFD